MSILDGTERKQSLSLVQNYKGKVQEATRSQGEPQKSVAPQISEHTDT